jgi:hypothetical protein
MHRRGSARDRSEFLVIKLLARLSLAGLYLRGSITGFPSPTPPNSPGNMATRLTFSIGVSGWSVLVGGPRQTNMVVSGTDLALGLRYQPSSRRQTLLLTIRKSVECRIRDPEGAGFSRGPDE